MKISLIILSMLLVLQISCNPSSKESNSGSEGADIEEDGDLDGAEQPANIAGLPLTGMICYEVPSAEAQVGCRVIDEKGKKYNGEVKEPKLAIKTASTVPVEAVFSKSDVNSEFTFYVDIGEADPADILNIQIDFIDQNGQSQQLTAPLIHGRILFATASDLALYVDSKATVPSISCTKELPCKAIGDAIALVPSAIEHNVEIFVKSGVYKEEVNISGRSVTLDKRITIKGTGKDFTGEEKFEIDGKTADHYFRTCFKVSLAGEGAFQLRNFHFKNCGQGLQMGYLSNAVIGNGKVSSSILSTDTKKANLVGDGIAISNSNVSFSNIEVVSSQKDGVSAKDSNVDFLGNFTASQNRGVGIRFFQSKGSFGQIDNNSSNFTFDLNGVAAPNEEGGAIHGQLSEINMYGSNFMFSKNHGDTIFLRKNSSATFVKPNKLEMSITTGRRLMQISEYSYLSVLKPALWKMESAHSASHTSYLVRRNSNLFIDMLDGGGMDCCDIEGILATYTNSTVFINDVEATMDGPQDPVEGWTLLDMSTLSL